MIFLQNIAPAALPDSVPSVKEELGMLKSMPVDEFINAVVSGLVKLAINLAIAIVVFYVGRFIINRLHRLLTSIFIRRRIDQSLGTFLLSLVRMLLYFILIVTVIGILGIETSSFIAIFASAGVAIGMALSGTLQNFAGGVLILLIKPYRVGDYIETQGYAGTVKEIQIFHTIINTFDNKSLILPNGALSTGNISNWNREDYRRVDWPVSISYGDSVDTAREAILEILRSDSRIVKQYVEDARIERAARVEEQAAEDGSIPPEVKRPGWFRRLFKKKVRPAVIWNDPAIDPKIIAKLPKVDRSPSIVVNELADSSVNLKARAWVHRDDYWSVFYRINERIYTELPASGVSFPFPQMDVHLDRSAAGDNRAEAQSK
ncbi:MAG: mechanosensitive ion channel [Muribaculaceae bacterium]|nr:mechanosensitive ion channel [Muribaculaceae bacterium]